MDCGVARTRESLPSGICYFWRRFPDALRADSRAEFRAPIHPLARGLSGRLRTPWFRVQPTSLIDKQALDIAKKEISDQPTARVYRVYSPQAILERRRLHGQEWVVRGRGVEFVRPRNLR